MGMGTKRPVDSGQKDAAGRPIKVSDQATETRADAPVPPAVSDGMTDEFKDKILGIVDDSLTAIAASEPAAEPATSYPMDTAMVRAAAHRTSWAEKAAPLTGATVRITGTNVNQRYAGQTGTVTDYRPGTDAAPGCRKVRMDDGHEINIFPDRPGEYTVVDHNIAPHPEYDYDKAWTAPEVRTEVEALPWKNPGETVTDIMEILDRHGYDSIDRELAFWHWSQRTGLPYDRFYNAWLHSN